jgi:RNA polymerase sigma factor (sigma-70 family)
VNGHGPPAPPALLTQPPDSFKVNVHDAGHRPRDHVSHDSDVEMRATGTNVKALVVAAQAGDRRALEGLISAHLPLIYTIARRALSDHPDADDVVQEVVLRVLGELRDLRAPDSFRAWLAAIAVRQVSTYLHKRHRAVTRTTPLDAVIDVPDAAANVENLAVLRLELAGQRGEVVRASRWLDPDDQALLSLWWLEVGGQLGRTELSEALGVSVAHAGVRVQRMRAQLDLSRSVVAALETRPRCRRLDSVTAGWDGLPGPMWRKRMARHVRSCAQCIRAAGGRVPTERLLVGSALLPVPAALAGAALGKLPLSAAAASTTAGSAGVGVNVGLLSQLAQAVVAHPIAAACLAGTLVAGAAMATANWPGSALSAPSGATGRTSARPNQPVVAQSPSPAPSSLAPGPVSLEAANQAGFFVSTTNTFGVLVSVGPDNDSQARQRATFEVVAGLADPSCFSFRLPDGQYLRHSSWRLRVFGNDGTALFRGDATFCARPGSVSGSVSLESSNYPGWFLHHRGNDLWVDQPTGTAAFGADSSFHVRKPLSS